MALHYKQECTALTGSQTTLRKMLALIPALAVAVLCYSVTVYAWFSASIGNTGNIITAATYGLEVSVFDANKQPVQPQDGVYPLSDSLYTVTLTKTGEATTGYCVVNEGENTYYTAPITTESPTLTFTIAEPGQYTFTAAWGDYTGEGAIPNGGFIGTPTNPANELNAIPAADDTAPTSSKLTETTVPESATTTQPTEYQTQQPAVPTTESAFGPSTTEPSTNSEPTITISEPSSAAPSETESSSAASAEKSSETAPTEPEAAPTENATVSENEGTDSSMGQG